MIKCKWILLITVFLFFLFGCSSAEDSASFMENISEQSNSSETEHEYQCRVISETCSEQGYTQYTCIHCGYSYEDQFVLPAHQYENYLCLFCGKPDPENVESSLPAWLRKNGTIPQDSNTCLIEFSADLKIYDISCPNIPSSTDLSFSFLNLEKNSSIGIYFEDTTASQYYYQLGDKWGRVNLKNADIRADMDLSWDEFSHPGDTDAYDALACEGITELCSFLTAMEKELLLPEAGLTLADLGYTML